MCVISVFNYLLSVIVLWGWPVECRICKWKLLSVDRTFVAAFTQLTSFKEVGLVSHILLHSNKLSASKLLTV